jgi:hypothetical protein
LLDAAADAFFNLQHVDFALDDAEDLLETDTDVADFQDPLLLRQLERQVRGNGIGEPASLIDTGQ